MVSVWSLCTRPASRAQQDNDYCSSSRWLTGVVTCSVLPTSPPVPQLQQFLYLIWLPQWEDLCLGLKLIIMSQVIKPVRVSYKFYKLTLSCKTVLRYALRSATNQSENRAFPYYLNRIGTFNRVFSWTLKLFSPAFDQKCSCAAEPHP